MRTWRGSLFSENFWPLKFPLQWVRFQRYPCFLTLCSYPVVYTPLLHYRPHSRCQPRSAQSSPSFPEFRTLSTSCFLCSALPDWTFSSQVNPYCYIAITPQPRSCTSCLSSPDPTAQSLLAQRLTASTFPTCCSLLILSLKYCWTALLVFGSLIGCKT